MLDPTIQGGGGTIRYPVPQNAMMNLRKSPMDMNTNRYEKLVQVPPRGAERASSDGVTIEQCQSAYRQSTKTPVTEVYTNFADKPEPTLYQGTAVAAEEAGTDGTTNVRGRSIDCDNMRTTVMKLPTFTEPTLARVSPVVAKMDTNEITINRIVGFVGRSGNRPGRRDADTGLVAGSDRRPCDSSSGDSRSVRPGRRFRS